MDSLSAVLGIILIDLVLSGDNAIVIGMAAHRLSPRQRRLAIVVGGGAAVVLRISLTAIAALLLTIPGLQAAGGLLLLLIAYRLLQGDEEEHADGRVPVTFRGAVLTILLADFLMSLDNVLGVAAASGGNLTLLVFGLVLSIAILMIGGSLVATMINRFWWLSYVGAAVIAWTGIDMFFDDPFVEHLGSLPAEVEMIVSLGVTALVVGLAHLAHRRPARSVS